MAQAKPDYGTFAESKVTPYRLSSPSGSASRESQGGPMTKTKLVRPMSSLPTFTSR